MTAPRQTKAQIERAVSAGIAAATSQGIEVGAVEIMPDGRVRIERATVPVVLQTKQAQDKRTPIAWT